MSVGTGVERISQVHPSSTFLNGTALTCLHFYLVDVKQKVVNDLQIKISTSRSLLYCYLYVIQCFRLCQWSTNNP